MGKFDPAPTVAAGLIRLARLKGDLTQTELGGLAGVDQQVISAYETGRRDPSLSTLTKLLAAAGFEMRIQLAPIDPQDQDLARFLESLPPDDRRAIDETAKERVEQARLRRVRGK